MVSSYLLRDEVFARQSEENQVLQSILSEPGLPALSPSDLAFLVLIKFTMASRPGGVNSLYETDLRILYRRIDELCEGAVGNLEKSVTHTLSRLTLARCIVRVDFNRLLNEEAEYSLTLFGAAAADFLAGQSSFTGETLTVILREFVAQLAVLAEKSRNLDFADDDWRRIQKLMGIVLTDMLSSVDRHCAGLDRAHQSIRERIPDLINSGSNDAISECEDMLANVVRVIRDLHVVTTEAVQNAYIQLQIIEDEAKKHHVASMTPVANEIVRRLEAIAQWVERRRHDWNEHHRVVNDYIRTSIRIDPQRRLMEALRKSLAQPPEWLPNVLDVPTFIEFRSHVIEREARQPVRRPVKDHSMNIQEIKIDDFHQRFNETLQTRLQAGEVSFVDLLKQELAAGTKLAKVVHRAPYMLDRLVNSGAISRPKDAARWVPVHDRMVSQDLSVKAKK